MTSLTIDKLYVVANGLEEGGFYKEATLVDDIILDMRGGDAFFKYASMNKEAQASNWIAVLSQFLPQALVYGVLGFFGIKWIMRNWNKIFEFVRRFSAKENVKPQDVNTPEKINQFIQEMQSDIGAPTLEDKQAPVDEAPAVAPDTVVPPPSKPSDEVETEEGKAAIAADRKKRMQTIEDYGSGILSDEARRVLRKAIAYDNYVKITYTKKSTGETKDFRAIPKEIGPHHKKPSQIVLWVLHDLHEDKDNGVHSFILKNIQDVQPLQSELNYTF